MFHPLVHVAWWCVLGRFGWVTWDTGGNPPPHECSILVGAAAVVAVIMLTRLVMDAREAAARLTGLADRLDAAIAKCEAALGELERRKDK